MRSTGLACQLGKWFEISAAGAGILAAGKAKDW
jgi:hypothetical protein